MTAKGKQLGPRLRLLGVPVRSITELIGAAVDRGDARDAGGGPNNDVVARMIDRT